MEIVISGYVTAILPYEQGTSKRTGQPWMKQSYVIQHEGGQYPRHLCFEIFGQEKIQQAAIRQGEYITVHLNADARAGQNDPNKWYNEIRCWRVERQTQQMQTGAPMPYNQPPMMQQQYAPQPQYQQAQNPFPPQQPVQNPFPPQQPAPAPNPAPPVAPAVAQPTSGNLPFPPANQ